MRCDYREVTLVREFEAVIGWRLEVEVREPVVHEINGLTAASSAPSATCSSEGSTILVRIPCDSNKCLGKLELGIKILCGGILIDDRDGAESGVFAGQTPFTLEHGNDFPVATA